jgi:hypothetical protein
MSNVWSLPVPCTAERKFERIADALIAAKIGDVKDLQAQVDVLEITNIALQAGYDDAEKDRLYWVDKYKEAEHRAEVAEKALDLCETAYILSLNHRATEGISGQAIASDLGVHKFFMEQAEKELAEDRKDG